MHQSVLEFVAAALSPDEIRGASVLEVGSQDVNGTPRIAVLPHGPAEYIGVDAAPGDGVDVVADAAALTQTFGVDRFDLVISTEMLEHAADWRTAVEQMKAVLKPGGILLVTTRSPGFPYHGYPDDHWRFAIEDFGKIFSDMEIVALAYDHLPGHPGVFIKAIATEETGVNNLRYIHVASAPEKPK